MKKLIIASVFLFITSLFSQKNDETSTMRNLSNSLNYNVSGQTQGVWIQTKEDNKIDGTPFLYNSWSNKMAIFTSDEKMYEIENSNFNLLKETFASKISNDSVFEFNNDKIKYVKLNDVIYKKFDYQNKKTYLAVVFNGNKASFLKKNSISIKKGTLNPMNQNKTSKDKYVIKNKYFAFINNQIVAFNPKKRSVLSIFKDKENKIKKFVKNNKISYKKENDITKLFKFYNSL